jgi:hypothetical protein
MTAGQNVMTVYGVIIVFAAFTIDSGRPNARAFETGRPLDVNHRIEAGDVIPAGLSSRMLYPSKTLLRDFDGRYLTSFHCAHEAIDFTMTRAQPDFRAGPHASLVWIALTAPRDPRIDANTRVDVCGVSAGAKSCSNDRQVAAVICDPAGADCQAGIWVADTERPAVFAAQNAPAAQRRTLRVFFTKDHPVRKNCA